MKSQGVVADYPQSCLCCWRKVHLNAGGGINNQRSRLLIFGCGGLLMFAYYTLLYSNANEFTCWSSLFYFATNDSLAASMSPAGLLPEIENDSSTVGKKAFFLETAGSETLSIRQACAVESLALHNPSLIVYVLFSTEQVNGSSATLHALTENYKNIRVIGFNIDNYLAGSPLEHWYKFTDWRKGPYHVAHFSDGLRLLTLSRYGGYYFDLDIIHVRPVTYYRNFIATEDGNTASNGVMHADYGYPLMETAINDFPANYRADAWTHNGPDLLGRVLTKWCGVKNLPEANYLKCRGFSVLPKSSFYPVHYGNWREFFVERAPNDTVTKPNWYTDEVIGVHMWNKLSYGEPLYRNSSQYYTQLARTHCPFTFSIATDVF